MYDSRLTTAMAPARRPRDRPEPTPGLDPLPLPGRDVPVPPAMPPVGSTAPPRRLMLGKAVPRGYGTRPRLSPDAAASFATLVDTARARAGIEGRTLVYTVRWD